MIIFCECVCVWGGGGGGIGAGVQIDSWESRVLAFNK